MKVLSHSISGEYRKRACGFLIPQRVLSRSLWSRSLLGAAMLFTACGHDDPAKIMEARPPNSVYHYGEKITFDSNGKSRGFTRGGWSDSEGSFTWTNGVAASLAVLIPEPATGPVTFGIRMEAFMRQPDVPSQPVEVVVNGQKLGRWNVTSRKVYAAIIPEKFVAAPNSVLFIDLYIPSASTPGSLTSGGDTRRLGLCVFDFSLTQTRDTDSQEAIEGTEGGTPTKP